MEYLPGGELFQLIRKQRFIKEGSDLKFYLAEIITGVETLHER
jgi:serine/threonine protein kinase